MLTRLSHAGLAACTVRMCITWLTVSVWMAAGGESWNARLRTSVLTVVLSSGGSKPHVSQLSMPTGDLPRSQ